MELLFRPARPEDAGELWRLNRAFNGPGDKGPEEMARDLEHPRGELTFVAQGPEGLAGFCCCRIASSWCYREEAAELTELYVEPAFRRQGAARGLVAQAEAACAARGIAAIQVLTGDDNREARACYESLGYALSGEVHYEKELAPPCGEGRKEGGR